MFLLTSGEYAKMLKDLILSANGNPELMRQLVSENSCRTKDELARAVVKFCEQEVDSYVSSMEAYMENYKIPLDFNGQA